MNIYKVFWFAFTIVVVNGQFADFLFPSTTKLVKEKTKFIVQHPLVVRTAQISGEALANRANSITNFPIDLERNFGFQPRLSLPALPISISSILADSEISKYKAGLSNEDIDLSIDKLITKYGYPLEIHEVKTCDGYILSLYRIPRNGSAVFLMHSLLGSADDFIISGPEKGMAYLLAKDGYDVWMGNARGNKHSRRHVHLEPTDAFFWDFSWDEIGYYDLPAMIDHILNVTKSEKLHYIGHSQGTTSFFVMASERPEYNDKISVMVSLSPVAYMSNVRSPLIRILSSGGTLIFQGTKSLGAYELLPDDALIRAIKKITCGFGPLSDFVCENIIFLIVGFDFEQANMTNLPVMLGHLPSGASVKQVVHYGQGVITEDFRKFDYGVEENILRYGSEVPPRYALEKITAPVSLFYSEDDWLAHPIDVKKLYNKLCNCTDVYKIPFQPFNHLDFLFAKDFVSLVYVKLQKLLANF